MARKKKYPEELLDRGARLAFESGRPIAHVARDLGIHPENAMAESFVDTFETELIVDRSWRSRTQLELAVVEYIAWFNSDRLHESLGESVPRGVRVSIRCRGGQQSHIERRLGPTKTVSVKPGPAHWGGLDGR